jgi:hypothetical protein
MPSKQEIFDAVEAAAGAEAMEVATRIKELEDAIVAAQMTDEDKAKLVAMVQNIHTPAAPQA